MGAWGDSRRYGWADGEAGEIQHAIDSLLEPYLIGNAPHVVVIGRRDVLDRERINNIGLCAKEWRMLSIELQRYRRLIECAGTSEDQSRAEYCEGKIAHVSASEGAIPICRCCAHVLGVPTKEFEHGIGERFRAECGGCGGSFESVESRIAREAREEVEAGELDEIPF